MKELVAVQPDFEIHVNTHHGKTVPNVADLIRRRDWYGTADVNVVEDGLVPDGVTPVAMLEFTRYEMVYSEDWRPTKSERRDIRIVAKDVETAMAMALAWITEHHRITLDQHTDAELLAFHEEQRALQQKAWREKHGF